eukprot:COSAG06_NODE_2774_length_6303_cov_15.722115_3_plen_95_part_00
MIIINALQINSTSFCGLSLDQSRLIVLSGDNQLRVARRRASPAAPRPRRARPRRQSRCGKNGPRFSLSSAAFEHLIRGSFFVDAHMHYCELHNN